MDKILIYTDGSSLGNPGRGGYGAVLKFNKNEKEIFGGFKRTTNNRMELMAVIKSMKALKRPCRVVLYSDSKYIVDAVSKGWLENWQKKNWKKSDKKDVKNVDLWRILVELLDLHDVDFQWTKGHAGDFYNEKCDKLAKKACDLEVLEDDIGYTK